LYGYREKSTDLFNCLGLSVEQAVFNTLGRGWNDEVENLEPSDKDRLKSLLLHSTAGKFGDFFKTCIFFNIYASLCMLNNPLKLGNWVWWYMSVISALWRLRQKDHKFKANLDYITIL
jgi:hypothetical protein